MGSSPASRGAALEEVKMSKSLDAIQALPWVAHVDDEREDGSSIIVTLKQGYEFAGNAGCGVQGFDTVAAAKSGTCKSAVIAA